MKPKESSAACAEHEVAAVLARYTQALDHRTWLGAAALFLPDGVLAFGQDMIRGPHAIAARMRADLSVYHGTHHHVGLPRVELDGDVAHVSASCIGTHVRDPQDGATHTVVGGRYEAELRRTPEGWRINRMTPHYAWRSGPPLSH
ncbi:nuclear transport factor 2 family protein [Streptomyces sp. NPDC005799]|uniref:nuclear transport factor 2 family protein n=1 Tax=Streptomyces sp. NPDC005799 TaxID=3154678 RepID=UPI0033FF0780